jgi:hypothetical protein
MNKKTQQEVNDLSPMEIARAVKLIGENSIVAQSYTRGYCSEVLLRASTMLYDGISGKDISSYEKAPENPTDGTEPPIPANTNTNVEENPVKTEEIEEIEVEEDEIRPCVAHGDECKSPVDGGWHWCTSNLEKKVPIKCRCCTKGGIQECRGDNNVPDRRRYSA